MGTRLKCTECDDIIESKHVHDFRRCKCHAIFVDGGDDYLRYGGHFHHILIEDKEGNFQTVEDS